MANIISKPRKFSSNGLESALINISAIYDISGFCIVDPIISRDSFAL